MKWFLYTMFSMSQFHQVILICLMSSIIVSIIKLIVKDKPDLVYQLMVASIYLALELFFDIALSIYFFVDTTPTSIFQEFLTIISGVALTLVIYDQWKKIWKGIKEAINAKK